MVLMFVERKGSFDCKWGVKIMTFVASNGGSEWSWWSMKIAEMWSWDELRYSCKCWGENNISQWDDSLIDANVVKFNIRGSQSSCKTLWYASPKARQVTIVMINKCLILDMFLCPITLRYLDTMVEFLEKIYQTRPNYCRFLMIYFVYRFWNDSQLWLRWIYFIQYNITIL